jgi:hypothetical protein
MKINIDEIICLNLRGLNAQQLFAICETYFLGFEYLYETKMEGDISLCWINHHDKKTVAYVTSDLSSKTKFDLFLMSSSFPNTSMQDQERLKAMKPLNTPKMPKTASALNNYKAFLAEGYDIRTQSMDSKLAAIEAAKQREIEIERLKESLPVVLEVDAILEKISEYGIYFITKEEKDFLDKQ